jgi:hypothetical protein
LNNDDGFGREKKTVESQELSAQADGIERPEKK